MKPPRLSHALLLLSVVAAKKHVIRSPKLDQSLELGEVLAEKTVESAAACGQLCAAEPECHTVMLLGQRCLMFAYLYSYCPTETTPVQTSNCPSPFVSISADLESKYVIGKDTETTFWTAMSYCNSLGGYSVHINSKKEHEIIMAYITNTMSDSCVVIWTGGWTDKPGPDPKVSGWKWITSVDDPDPVSMNYMDWVDGEPNGGEEHALVLYSQQSYGYADFPPNLVWSNTRCFICECP